MYQLTLWAQEGLDLTLLGLHSAALSWVLCSEWTCTSLWLGLAWAGLSSVDHTPLGLSWVLGVEQHPCREDVRSSPLSLWSFAT